MPPVFRGAVLACEVCGGSFKVPPSRAHKAKTCSNACAGVLRGKAQEKRVAVTCKQCAVVFDVPECHAPKRTFCSTKCRDANPEHRAAKSAARMGAGNPMWKGGVTPHSEGYRYQQVGHEHPFAWQGYVLSHRRVMEVHLRENDPESPFLVKLGDKLYLSPEFLVHHDDENKANDHISNLICMTPGDHQRLHNERRRNAKSLDGQTSLPSITPTP